MYNVKNPETYGYEKGRRLRSEKLKRNEITITETRKNDTRKKLQTSQDICEISWKGRPMSIEGRI